MHEPATHLVVRVTKIGIGPISSHLASPIPLDLGKMGAGHLVSKTFCGEEVGPIEHRIQKRRMAMRRGIKSGFPKIAAIENRAASGPFYEIGPLQLPFFKAPISHVGLATHIPAL